MRLLKILTSILVLIVFVTLLAVSALIWLVDPNQIKATLIAEMEQQTGYNIKIDGKLSWAFYPRIGIAANHVTVQSPDQPAPFLDMKNLKVAADFSQLIHGDFAWNSPLNRAINGHVYIQEVRLANLKMQKVSANVTWEKKTLTLNPIKASLYEGSFQGTVHGNQFANNPHWDWNIQISNMQTQSLLNDLNPNSKIKLAGIGQVSFQGNTQGKGRIEITNNIDGKASFKLENGAITGVNMNHIVRMADALMNKGDMPANEDGNQTKFSGFTGTAVIKNGVATTQDLLLTSPAFITKGQGTLNLLTQNLKIGLIAKPQSDLRTQWQLPITITGTLNDPDINIDQREVQKFLAKEGLENIKEKVADKANDFLQNLLGNN